MMTSGAHVLLRDKDIFRHWQKVINAMNESRFSVLQERLRQNRSREISSFASWTHRDVNQKAQVRTLVYTSARTLVPNKPFLLLYDAVSLLV